MEHNSWEREEDLENTKEVVVEFEKRLNAEVRKQKKLDIAEERDFRREKLPKKYIIKMLYEWDDGKFEDEYLKKLERNRSQFLQRRNLEERMMLELQTLDFIFVFFCILILIFNLFFIFYFGN